MPGSFSDQPSASSELNSKEANARSDQESQLRRKSAHGRTDQGRVHATRSSAISRGLLQALKRCGENIRALRKMESELRAILRPPEPIGRLVFDIFWANVLRLILAARLEELGLTPTGGISKKSSSVPLLREGDLPTLMLPEGDPTDDPENSKPSDCDALFRRLALAARYNRAASREMYRALGLLLLMRDGGEPALKNWIRATMRIDPGGIEDA